MCVPLLEGPNGRTNHAVVQELRLEFERVAPRNRFRHRRAIGSTPESRHHAVGMMREVAVDLDAAAVPGRVDTRQVGPGRNRLPVDRDVRRAEREEVGKIELAVGRLDAACRAEVVGGGDRIRRGIGQHPVHVERGRGDVLGSGQPDV